MAIRQIVTVEDTNPVLRSVARPVARVDASVRKLMDDMVETMRDAPGVGLAAPQVGVPHRVIVVEVRSHEDDETETAGEGACQGESELYALANPEIVWSADELDEAQEACLSVPELFGDVPRHVAVTVRGLDRDGRKVEVEAEGYLARIFQHEIDHLDGILFPDRVESLEALYHLREESSGEYVRMPYKVPLLR